MTTIMEPYSTSQTIYDFIASIDFYIQCQKLYQKGLIIIYIVLNKVHKNAFVPLPQILLFKSYPFLSLSSHVLCAAFHITNFPLRHRFDLSCTSCSPNRSFISFSCSFTSYFVYPVLYTPYYLHRNFLEIYLYLFSTHFSLINIWVVLVRNVLHL